MFIMYRKETYYRLHMGSLREHQRQQRAKPGIVIVGAGIAGLATALTLQDAGFSSTIYEATGRIGGRIHTDTTAWGRQWAFEWGGTFIGADHHATLKLAQRFDLPLIDVLEMLPSTAQETLYFSNRHYTSAQFSEDFRPIYEILEQQMHAIGVLPDYQYASTEGSRLDHLSIADWITQYVPGGRTSDPGRFLHIGSAVQFGADSDQLSALNLMSLLDIQATYSGSESAVLGERYMLAGGNQQLPHALARQLSERCVHFQHCLTAIRQDSEQGVHLTFATPQGSQEVLCEYVILTLPFSTLRQTDCARAGFDVLKQATIARLGYGSVAKLMLQFKTRYWLRSDQSGAPGNGRICTDLGFQAGWDATCTQAEPGGILAVAIGGRQSLAYSSACPYTTTQENPHVRHHALRILEQLEVIFPGISDHYTGNAALSYPSGDPACRGAYACWLVGQYTSLRGYERVRQGHIYFAGEHTSLEYQGYIEGAVRSGIDAAHELLADCAL